MKSLLTKHRNFLMLVSIKQRGKRNWTFPVSLWALEETLEALNGMAWLWQRILRVLQEHLLQESQHKWVSYLAHVPLNTPIELLVEILRDLRHQERFRLVEVEEDDFRVYIDLY